MIWYFSARDDNNSKSSGKMLGPESIISMKSNSIIKSKLFACNDTKDSLKEVGPTTTQMGQK